MNELLLALSGIMILLVLVGVFADPIAVLVRRRVPNFIYQGDKLLLSGLILLAVFGLALVLIYLVTTPWGNR